MILIYSFSNVFHQHRAHALTSFVGPILINDMQTPPPHSPPCQKWPNMVFGSRTYAMFAYVFRYKNQNTFFDLYFLENGRFYTQNS